MNADGKKIGRPAGRKQDTFLKIRIPEELKDRFVGECERRQVSSAVVLRFFIQQWLDKTEQQHRLEDILLK